MKKRLLASSPQRWTFAFLLLACLTSVITSGQSDKAAQPRLPGGNYTVVCRAFMGHGYESLLRARHLSDEHHRQRGGR